MAYYPTLQASSSRLDFEGGERRTITLSQPLISAEKFATMKEAEPRAQLAQATFLVREQDLALRLFKSVAEVIRAVESLSTNGSRIEALQQQAAAARKSYELGQGTITDLRDTQVRLDQARATDLSIKARRSAAERQYASIVGASLPPRAYSLAREKRDVRLAGVDSYMSVALEINPQIVTARTNARLGELGVMRARGAFLPTLSANVVQSTLSGGTGSTFTGVVLSLPLQPSSFLNVSGTEANLNKLKEMVREAEQQVRLDVERLLTFVDAGRGETDIRLDAIRSAELSVTANEKSFAGGVRTTIDVLNSIQALYQTREEYVNAVLTLAENLLMVRLKVVMPVQECLNEVSSLLF
jgi:protease secretion system outer membrane protein